MSIYKGKKVLITGASSGIGFCTRRRVSKKRIEVLISARSKDKLETLAKKN